MTVVGVDGCSAGWFAIRVEDDFADDPTTATFPSMRLLLDAWGDASLVLIDIPIGLPDAERPSRRADLEARKVLGRPRASSVFPAPGRAAITRLRSSGPDSYKACSEANRRELGTKKGMSQQAYGILPKIADIDELLLSDDAARTKIREVHPEVCFWGLNGQRPMAHKKKDAFGLRERLDLIAGLLPWAASVYEDTLSQYLRARVGRDDILDAMAAAATAIPDHPLLSDLRSVPSDPQKDAHGLPMEMLYRLPR